jgi:hypothetical protein
MEIGAREGGRRINTTLIRDPPEIPSVRACSTTRHPARSCAHTCNCNAHPKAVKCRRKNISQFLAGKRGVYKQAKRICNPSRAYTIQHKSHLKHCALSALETRQSIFPKLWQYIASWAVYILLSRFAALDRSQSKKNPGVNFFLGAKMWVSPLSLSLHFYAPCARKDRDYV